MIIFTAVEINSPVMGLNSWFTFCSIAFNRTHYAKKAKTRLADPELINQFKAIEQMEEDDRNVVKKLIDAFITKKQIQKLAQ